MSWFQMVKYFQWLEKLWYQVPFRYKWPCWPLNGLYYLGMCVDRRYRSRKAAKRTLSLSMPHKSQKNLDPMVIIVGNIHVGGQGKTPVVVALAKRLQANNFTVAVVCKPYKTKSFLLPRIVVPSQATAEQVGDEALMLAKQLNLSVVAASSRNQALDWLQKYYPQVDMVVCDDGLQDWSFQPRFCFRVVVVDPDCCQQKPLLLPSGPLRQPWSDISAVNAILWREHRGCWPDYHQPSWVWQLKLQSQAVSLADPQIVCPLVSFQSQPLTILTGIARGERLVKLLKQQGIVGEVVTLADHAKLMHTQAWQHQTILMTEKDAVKYPHAPANWYSIGVEVELPEAFIEHIMITRQSTDNTHCH